MRIQESYGLVARYFTLLLFGMFNLAFFYWVFTPLTVYPVYFILLVFDSTTTLLYGNLLFFSGVYAQIIPACVAGAAYYLLLFLNLTTEMEPKKRAKSLIFLFGSFLILNILRIVIFAFLHAGGYEYFDAAHRFFWYFGSTVLVIIIWFANILLFNIRHIPVYTDVRRLFRDAFGGENEK